MPKTGAIDLLPEVTEVEVKEVKTKGKVNLFGVLAVLIVIVITVVILGGNLLFRLSYNNKNQVLADTKAQVEDYQYIEIEQRTLNNKISTFNAINEYDFSPDTVLTYLRDISQGLTITESFYLNDTMNFELRGKADSYVNVARLWHEMSVQQEYFQYVNLEYVRKDSDSDENEDVMFSFSGRMIKENVDDL